MLNKTLIFQNTVISLLFVGSASTALAASPATANLSVSASVADNCTFPSSPTLAFGTYDPTSTSSVTLTGTMSIKCNKGAVITSIGMGNGSNYTTTRNMSNGTDTLPYNVTLPSGATFGSTPAAGTCPATPNANWGNASGSWLVPTAGNYTSTTTSTVSICGAIPVGASVGAGSYSDTVVITVTFT